MNDPKIDYEREDLSLPVILKVWAGLLSGLLLVAAVCGLTLHAVKSQSIPVDSGPVDQLTDRRLPPAPRLQMNPPADLKKMNDAETIALNTYGWVDQAQGIIHIPISRAMVLMAERGLPARKNPHED